jgi:hypothetical protein
MPERRTYTGGCHCGQVRFEVESALEPVINCNCSICQKRGALLTFVPTAQFKIVSGEEELTDYQFNKKIVHHLFCRQCGIGSFARGRGPDGSEMIAINVRCLDDVDIGALTLTPYDGKNL